MVIPTEYVSSICEIKTMDNNLIATGIIDEITGEYIEIGIKSGKISATHFATEVKINVFNSRLGFRVLVGNVYTSSMDFIRVIDVNNILDYERRHFFRVDLDLKANVCVRKKREGEEDGSHAPATLELISQAGPSRQSILDYEDAMQEVLAENYDLLPIKVKNLSISGLMFTTTEIFQDQVLLIQMKIERFSGPFPCKIKRVLESGKKELLYGCEFIKMSEDVSDALCRYIFQRQREQINARAKN